MKKTGLYIDDSLIPDSVGNIEILKRFGKRHITYVFHDIDGTHSLIRDWQPVMSLTLHYVIKNGLPEGYDSDENVSKLIKMVGIEKLEETDKFCVESAGLSALSQMEWAIRRAIENKTISPLDLQLDGDSIENNSYVIKSIWNGEEKFDYLDEPNRLKLYLEEHTPRLFRLYEKILNGACRDANIIDCKKDPEAFRVKGSLQFIKKLHDLGAKNYFITGAVVNFNGEGMPEGGMYEEVCATGYEVGQGLMIEAIYGSTWDKKIPKIEVMKKVCMEQRIDPVNVLIVGDGRSEIAAGVSLNSVTISCLPKEATRQRELHKKLGTNIIVSDYTSPALYTLFQGE